MKQIYFLIVSLFVISELTADKSFAEPLIHPRRDHHSDETNLNDPFILLPQPVCHVSHIKLVLKGDNAKIHTFKALFENNQVEVIPFHTPMLENQETVWKDLMTPGLCLKGFDVDAVSDHDYDHATISIFALQGINGHHMDGRQGQDLQEIPIFTINIREDFQRRDRWHRDRHRNRQDEDDYGHPRRSHR